MGARKHNSAEAMKAARKELYFAKANGIPTSPRKMRLVADMVSVRCISLLVRQVAHSRSS